MIDTIEMLNETLIYIFVVKNFITENLAERKSHN